MEEAMPTEFGSEDTWETREAKRNAVREQSFEQAARTFCELQGVTFDQGFLFANEYYFTTTGGNILYQATLDRTERNGHVGQKRELVVREAPGLQGGALGGVVQAAMKRSAERTDARWTQAVGESDAH